MSDTDHLDAESQGIHNHHQQHHNYYSHRQPHIQAASQGHVPGHHVHMHDMHMQGQIEGDLHGHPEAQVHGGDHGHLHMHYMHEHGHSLHHNEDNGLGEEQDEGGGDNDGMEGDVPSDGGNLGDPQVVVPVRTQGTNQLTLSYQGEVYVFDTVPPEKNREPRQAARSVVQGQPKVARLNKPITKKPTKIDLRPPMKPAKGVEVEYPGSQITTCLRDISRALYRKVIQVQTLLRVMQESTLNLSTPLVMTSQPAAIPIKSNGRARGEKETEEEEGRGKQRKTQVKRDNTEGKS
eukprot:Gb_21624 [translate_table: standard]